MIKLLCVGAGGFLGSISRYSAGLLVYRLSGHPSFPVGTLAVNLIGCFIIGFLGQLGEQRHLFGAHMHLLVFAGFLGGFTTFSSFGYETVTLMREARPLVGMLNAGVSLFAGCLLVAAGIGVARLLRAV